MQYYSLYVNIVHVVLSKPTKNKPKKPITLTAIANSKNNETAQTDTQQNPMNKWPKQTIQEHDFIFIWQFVNCNWSPSVDAHGFGYMYIVHSFIQIIFILISLGCAMRTRNAAQRRNHNKFDIKLARDASTRLSFDLNLWCSLMLIGGAEQVVSMRHTLLCIYINDLGSDTWCFNKWLIQDSLWTLYSTGQAASYCIKNIYILATSA